MRIWCDGGINLIRVIGGFNAIIYIYAYHFSCDKKGILLLIAAGHNKAVEKGPWKWWFMVTSKKKT